MTATRMLVSVRSVAEAALAADGGADFIDLKEPRDGALGGLAPALIAEIVTALRRRSLPHSSMEERDRRLPVSATIGDLPMGDLQAILAQVEAVGACGVDYVKVGIERDAAAPAVLDALAASGWSVVPVFIGDRGLDAVLVDRACRLGFAALMVDTADKRAGSLFDAVPSAELRRFIDASRAAGALAGLAGALRLEHLPKLHELAPDFAGFRSAVCAGDRSGALDLALLRGLAARMSVGADVVGRGVAPTAAVA